MNGPNFLSWFRNKLGQARGYGWCLRCGGTWNWKKGHTLWIKEGQQGLFPLCEECWSEMSDEDKLRFCRVLFDEWNRWLGKVGSPLEDEEALIEQARIAIEREWKTS